jgi:pyruvate/2-oxoglutarate dehydrogenase complex dihydrolipoamide dehydrogenase (E3) component
MTKELEVEVLVIGGGPAGVLAALRAAELGARTALVTRGRFGGMAAHDGPVPVRTLAHAARLMRDARELDRYGIAVTPPTLDYERLVARAHEVASEVESHAALRAQIDAAHVEVHEDVGDARFVGPHTIETQRGPRIRADKIILCTGGSSRRLDVPGFELTATHSDAWGLRAVPASMIVVGGGATGVQVASIFGALGARVELFETGPRILRTEDHDVSAAVADAFRHAGISVHEDFGNIEAFERTAAGTAMVFSKGGERRRAEAALVVVAVGWAGNSERLDPAKAGIATDARGFVRVDAHLRTSVPHVFAAGDLIGRVMLVPQAMEDGLVAGTNAVRGPMMTSAGTAAVTGSFTDPEYAHAGLTEAEVRKTRDPFVARVPFDATTRMIIDGRTEGFCKLIVDRQTRTVLGCHVVGDRAVDIAQAAAIAIAAGMRVDELARAPLAFPTYTGVLCRAAAVAARQLDGSGARVAALL